MFGNFDQKFGLPAFPLEGIDPQGGLFGVNVPPSSDPTAAQPLPGSAQPTPRAGMPAPAAGLPEKGAQPALGAPSPLGGGVLSPGSGLGPVSMNDPGPREAPAAGVGSPFGKVNV